MMLRADHVAGGAVIAFGLLIFVLSDDLPFGTLAFPGSGFLPKLIAALLLALGAILFLRARESRPLSEMDWGGLAHAGLVVLVTAAAIPLYTRLGFGLTIGLLLFGLLIIVERKRALHAAPYAAVVAVLAYLLFQRVLKAPVPQGPLGF